MFRKLICCILVLFVSAPSSAKVYIQLQHRVANIDGRCLYACLTMLGKHLEVKQLYDFERDGKHYSVLSWYCQWPSKGATEKDTKDCLDNLKVKYTINGKANYEWLEKELEAGPVMTSFTHQKDGKPSCHAIIITGLDAKHVHYVDPNDIKHDWQWERDDFDTYWDHWVVVIHKK